MIVTPVRFAVDSNVMVYLFSGDAVRADRAEALMTHGRPKPVISVQVMNEVARVLSRKMGLAWPEIHVLLDDVEALCDVVPLTLEVHKDARRIAERYGYRLYDSCIIACALLEDCEVLYSEDMRHGQVIFGRMRLVNPFLPAGFTE